MGKLSALGRSPGDTICGTSDPLGAFFARKFDCWPGSFCAVSAATLLGMKVGASLGVGTAGAVAVGGMIGVAVGLACCGFDPVPVPQRPAIACHPADPPNQACWAVVALSLDR